MRLDLSTPGSQALFAAAVTIFSSLPWLILPAPVAPLGFAILLLGLGVATRWPFTVCLTFALISCFRLHEAVPGMAQLKLPLFFGMLAIWAFTWHVILTASVETYWPKEAKNFICFFILLTVGVLFAKNRDLAMDFWSGVMLKVFCMTFALMWLTRAEREFEMVGRGILLGGCAVALAAIYNKVQGIGLVEGTRVTVGRDLDSPLGDPNLLALTLILPISFAGAFLFSRTGWFNQTLGLVGGALAIVAVVFTQSRGGLLGMVAVIGVIGWHKVRSRTTLVTVGLLAGFALYAAMGISERVSGGAADLVDEASESRLQAWQTAVNMALVRPLSGVGLANFSANYSIFAAVWTRHDYTAHSIWFLVLGEAGFPGLIVFVSMIWHMVSSAFGTLDRLKKGAADAKMQAVSLGLAAGMVGYCVGGSFLSASYAWQLYVALAIAAALEHKTQAGRAKGNGHVAGPVWRWREG